MTVNDCVDSGHILGYGQGWFPGKISPVDVIIPLKDRRTVVSCVTQLLALKGAIDTIWLCDGGSSDAELLADLERLKGQPKVRVLPSPMISGKVPQKGLCQPWEAIAGFNKATLINRGIAQANAEFLLVSDADILWPATAIEALLTAVQAEPDSIAYVQTVQESNPQSDSLRRSRYRYRLYRETDRVTIAIETVPPQSDPQRPGCGLICARRHTLLQLGGYKDCFRGWGWEDQDLLMRAELLGFSIITAGAVTHLSHSDACRNQFYPGMEPTQSRDRNILTCLTQLQARQVLGSLASSMPGTARPTLPTSKDGQAITIHISLPEAFVRPADPIT
ncbi:MAG: glycosyltransferase [Cyanobacteria bacterium J06639_16]